MGMDHWNTVTEDMALAAAKIPANMNISGNMVRS